MNASAHAQPKPAESLAWMAPLLDRVETPILLADRRGEVLRANAALARLQARVGAGRSLRPHIVTLLAQLQRALSAAGVDRPSAMEKEVVLGETRLRLLAAPLEVPAQDASTLYAILVEPVTPLLPDVAQIRIRHGLSRRQSEVALLLAQGQTNDQVAAALRISPHTARRHTERVLGKLGVSRRGGVAQRLLLT